MKNNSDKIRVSRARKFVGGLALILALCSTTGCSLNNKNINNVNNSNDIVFDDESKHIEDDIIIENTLDEKEEIKEETKVEDKKEEVKEDKKEETNSNKDKKETKKETKKQDITTPVTEGTIAIPDIGDYKGISIVEALALVGSETSFNYRKQLAKVFGIENYRGTEAQNLLLIELLRNYSELLKQIQVINKTPETNTNNNGNSNNVVNEEHHDNGNHEEHKHDNEHSHHYNSWQKYTSTLEVRECSCGEKEYRSHSFKTPTVRYVQGVLNHKKETYVSCGTCSYGYITSSITEAHVFTDYRDNHNGTETGTCVCGKTNTRDLDHTHSYGSNLTRYIDNGTTHTKEVYKKCSEVGCNAEQIVSRTTVAHSFTSYVDNHDCTETATCECGKTDTRNKEHVRTWSNFSDTQEKGVCSTCGDVIYRSHTLTSNDSAAVGNNNGTHTITNTKTCSTCDYTKTTPNVESCTSDGVTHKVKEGEVWYLYNECSECGDKLNKTAHNTHSGTYSNGNATGHTLTCSTCGESFQESHSWDYPSYHVVNGTQIRTCNDCGYVDSLEHTHSFSSEGSRVNENGQCIKVQICSNCGEEVRTPVSHTMFKTYSSDKTKEIYTCSGCGYVDEVAHSHDYDIDNVEDVGGVYLVTYVCECGHSYQDVLADNPVAGMNMMTMFMAEPESLDEIIDKAIEELIDENKDVVNNEESQGLPPYKEENDYVEENHEEEIKEEIEEVIEEIEEEEEQEQEETETEEEVLSR